MPQLVDVQNEIRGRLGDPSEAQLPSTQVDNAINGALREFSRYVPERLEYIIAVIEGTNEYDLPEGVIEVTEHAWRGESMEPLGFREYTPVRNYQKDTDAYPYWRNFHSDTLRHRDDVGPEFQVFDGSPPVLRIIPTPEMSGSLVLTLEKIPSLGRVPGDETENIVQWAVGDCLEYIGRKRSKSVQQIPTATGTLKLSDGADLRQEGCDLKDSVESSWGCGATVIDGG